MKTEFNYAIIKENNPNFERESVLSENKYKPTKYALIIKGCHKDGSELIYFIKYSNNLEALHSDAKQYPSWYNYPIGIYKELQGYLRELK